MPIITRSYSSAVCNANGTGNANIQITTHNEKQFYGSVCILVIERALEVHKIAPLLIFPCSLMN